ncbi:MAG TPA: hemolysin III family protein [Longimicrobiales bacterium]|nr:hemolysin III family protein [Longimicrobiales bacterium]
MTVVRRAQTSREERANAWSHGLGLALALVGIPVLVVGAVRNGSAADVVGSAVFGAAMGLLYLTSTLYHAAPPGDRKNWFRRLDHSAIFLLIAGTYTPFTLGVLGGAWGWTLFGIVWGLAALGIAVKLTAGPRWPILSTGLYLAMGWLVVVAIRPLWQRVPGQGIALLVAGGLAYTLGVAFYAQPRMRYAHLVWHLFVLAGTAFHFFAVLGYAT